MEQIPLNLDDTKGVPNVDLETLSDEEIAEHYKKIIGVNPLFRGFTREELIAGINSPDAEKARLREIDTASDKEDINNTYPRK